MKKGPDLYRAKSYNPNTIHIVPFDQAANRIVRYETHMILMHRIVLHITQDRTAQDTGSYCTGHRIVLHRTHR